MPNHKDLPSGSQSWARELDEALKLVAHLKDVVQRVTKDLGVDYANPKRGLSQGSVPSIQNPISLKLASLYDLDVRNLTPDDVLTWDADKQKWVARPVLFNFEGVNDGDVLTWDSTTKKWSPKPVSGGGATVIPADTWSQLVIPNYLVDPSFETFSTVPMTDHIPPGFTIASDVTISQNTSITHKGGASMRVAMTGTDSTSSFPYSPVHLRTAPLPTDAGFYAAYMYMPVAIPGNCVISVGVLVADSAGNRVDSRGGSLHANDESVGSWLYLDSNMLDSFTVPEGGSIHGYISLDQIPYGETYTMYIDSVIASNAYPPVYKDNFDGSTPDDADFSYSWQGAANNSISNAELKYSISVPAEIPAGSTIQVIGEGFPSGDLITLRNGSSNTKSVGADVNGAFDTTMDIGDATPLGTSTIEAASSGWYTPEVTVTIV